MRESLFLSKTLVAALPFFLVFILNGCSSEKQNESKKAAKPAKKQSREIAVEGYIATPHKTDNNFYAMATLEALNSVALTAASSGRLVKLYAKDGAKVQKNHLIAKIDDAELQAQLKQSEANLQLYKQKQERVKTLFEKQGATAQDLETAEANLKSAEASVELIKAQIAKTEIRAPFAGTLGFVNISEGAWLTTGSPITNLYDVKRLKAKFSVPQRIASSLKIGDNVLLKDEERNVQKTAHVKALEVSLSESSRTRQILVEVENLKGELLAGSYAKVQVEFETDNSSNTIPVPAEALTLDKDGAYVYVVNDGSAKIKHVETGLRTPIAVNITSGISPGDTVITSGLINLRQGSKIRVKSIRQNTDYSL